MNFEQIFSKWNRSEMYIETFEKHQTESRVCSMSRPRTSLPSSSVLRPWAYLTKIWQSNKKIRSKALLSIQ